MEENKRTDVRATEGAVDSETSPENATDPAPKGRVHSLSARLLAWTSWPRVIAPVAVAFLLAFVVTLGVAWWSGLSHIGDLAGNTGASLPRMSDATPSQPADGTVPTQDEKLDEPPAAGAVLTQDESPSADAAAGIAESASAANEAVSDGGETTAAAPASALDDVKPGKLVWPVNGPVSRTFGWNYNPTTDDWRWHPGLDLSADAGSKVYAMAAGRVADVHGSDDEGWEITIAHRAGLESVYAGLAQPLVTTDESVARGAAIGSVGPPPLLEAGDPTHVHFVLRASGAEVDPTLYLPTR